MDGRLSYGRFIPLYACLCPKMGESDIGDKCPQLHTTIESLNCHAKKTFALGDSFHLARVE
jgi:hypothetical protein